MKANSIASVAPLFGLVLAFGDVEAQVHAHPQSTKHEAHGHAAHDRTKHDHGEHEHREREHTAHDHTAHDRATHDRTEQATTGAGGHAHHRPHGDKARPPRPAAGHGPGRHEPVQQAQGGHRHADHSAMDHASMDHASMDHAATDHAATDHQAMGHPAPPGFVPVPPVTDADRAAAFPDVHGHTAHDRRVVSMVRFDRLEVWEAHEGIGQAWEAAAWIGNDHHKLWLRSEGEREGGHTESADLEVLYGRPVAPWWDLVAGIRHDFAPGASQTFAAVGVQGLAPYMFEIGAMAYLGESGQVEARIEAEYEVLLTNRLILQPLVEVTLHGRDDARRGVGSGLGKVEAGLRLRYEFTRRFAPYVGIVRERAYGRTAAFQRRAGEGVDDTHIVAGVRLWF